MHRVSPPPPALMTPAVFGNPVYPLLQESFSPFGKVYSIKIMWPRTDEERARKRNCGFVSYWKREAAVNAKRAMQDVDVEGKKRRRTVELGI